MATVQALCSERSADQATGSHRAGSVPIQKGFCRFLMNPLQVETVRCALACRERRCTLVRYLPTSCQSFCSLHCTWQVFNRRIGPQQIIESPTDVNQIFVDNKVKDCLVCTTTSLIPSTEKRSRISFYDWPSGILAYAFVWEAVGFSRTNDQFQRAATVGTYDGFSFCAALVTASAAAPLRSVRLW